MPLYVAADGSWGDAEGIAIIDDRDWTEFEYDLLGTFHDHNRADFAEAIDAWVKEGRLAFKRVSGYQFDMTSLEEVSIALAEWWDYERGIATLTEIVTVK